MVASVRPFLISIFILLCTMTSAAETDGSFRRCLALLSSKDSVTGLPKWNLDAPLVPKGIVRLSTNLAINVSDLPTKDFRVMTLADWQALPSPENLTKPTAVDIENVPNDVLLKHLKDLEALIKKHAVRRPIETSDRALVKAARLNSWPGESYRFDLRINGKLESFPIHKPGLFPNVSVKKFWNALEEALRKACSGKASIVISEIHFSHVHPIFDLVGLNDDGTMTPISNEGAANFSSCDLGIALWLSKLFARQLVIIQAVTLSDYTYQIAFLNGALAVSVPTLGKTYQCSEMPGVLGRTKREFSEGINNPRQSGYWRLFQEAALK